MQVTVKYLLISLLIGLLLMPPILAQSITINFMADSRLEYDRMVKLLPDFEKKSGIKVNFLQLQETPLRSKSGLELSAPSTDIDLLMLDFLFLLKYAKVGYLEPLDTYLKKSGTFRKKDFKPPFIEAVSYNGKMYGVPLYQDCNILVYRADLFKKYNLDVPKTMSDLEKNAKIIHDNEPGMAGIVMRGQRGMGINEWVWPTFLRSFGGSYYTKGNLKGNLDTPEAAAALEFYTGILKKYGPEGVANYSYVEVQNDMMQGKAGMFIDAAATGIRCEDPTASTVAGKLGYAMVPRQKTVQPGFYSWTLVIPAKSKRKEAAAKFLAWLVSPAIAKKVGWSAPDQALETVYNIPAYSGYKQSEPLLKVMEDSLKLADPDYRPRIPEENEVGTAISIAISEVLAGEKSAEQALKEANNVINEILTKSKYY